MKFPSWHVAQENCAAAERLADAGYPYLACWRAAAWNAPRTRRNF